jgi:CDP-glycerol glycerophosphotransferase
LAPLLWPLALVVPRRRGLWLFACIYGYRDNPRYLFEHVRTTVPTGVRPVWFAQSREEAEAVRALGHEAVWKRSPRGWWLQLRAGVIVIGSGPSELNRPLVGRAFVVQTWHGAPFKRIHADFSDQDVLLDGHGRLARFVNGLARRATFASRSRVGLIPCQSETVSTRFQSAWRVGPEVCPVLGTPRADVIGSTGPDADAEVEAVRDVVLPPELRSARRLLLYAPTWRDGRSEAFLADGLDVPALEQLLEEQDAVLIIKMHPQGDRGVFEAAGLTEPIVRRVLLGAADDVDVNVLLRAVDCLITDYSAISLDYALLRRPIVYFMPDLEDYDVARGLYESPSLLTGDLHCRSWPEVLAALRAAAADPSPYTEAVDAVIRRYWAFLDTSSCARITAEIVRRVGP